MIAFKSKMNTISLLFYSIIMLGIGIWSIWFDMLMIYKVISLIFNSLISAILFCTFIYYIRSPKEAFAIIDGKIIIYKRKFNEIYDLKNIKEILFNFNIPYWSIGFTFSIIMKNGEKIIIGCFIKKQVMVYKMMKQILIENNIKITREYHLK